MSPSPPSLWRVFVVVVLCRIFGPAVLVGISLLFLGVRLVCFPPPFLPLRIDLSHAPTVIKGERREHPPAPLWAFDCSSKAIGGFAYTPVSVVTPRPFDRSWIACCAFAAMRLFAIVVRYLYWTYPMPWNGLENGICNSKAAGCMRGTKIRSPYLL